MDCCNYMPYRHHQPYYGSQYFHENFPTYHGEFYGQPMYNDYYGMSPYYAPQQWQGFIPPDYVYNPKEARIRKAMREANRDRSIGASPMLPRPNARRATPHSWMPGQPEEQLMVPNLRCPPVPAGLEPCFPGIGNESFMPMPSGAYCGATVKMDAPLPPQAPTTPGLPQGSSAVHLPSEYMTQPNPLAQLQQQTEMWPGFHENMRPRSSNNPYMLQEVQPARHYHHQPSPPLSIPSPMAIDKHRQTPHPLHTLNNSPMPITPPHSNSNLSMTPPHSNENVPPDEPPHPKTEECRGFESKQQMLESATQPLMENNTIQHQQSNDGFITVLSPELQPTQRQFEQAQDLKIKKPNVRSRQICFNPNSASCVTKKPSPKALPDFNEAFGSTERGRFQSPPDPNRGPNKRLLDFFFEDTGAQSIKFDDYQI